MTALTRDRARAMLAREQETDGALAGTEGADADAAEADWEAGLDPSHEGGLDLELARAVQAGPEAGADDEDADDEYDPSLEGGLDTDFMR